MGYRLTRDAQRQDKGEIEDGLMCTSASHWQVVVSICYTLYPDCISAGFPRCSLCQEIEP
jgi:hypothetical protein